MYNTVIWCKHPNLLIPLLTRTAPGFLPVATDQQLFNRRQEEGAEQSCSYVSYIIHQGHPLWIQWRIISTGSSSRT